MINRFLQMTYIPNRIEQGTFFIWMTDKKENALYQEDIRFLKELLQLSKLQYYFYDQPLIEAHVPMLTEDGEVDVYGYLVPMHTIFAILQDDSMSKQGSNQQSFAVASSISSSSSNDSYFNFGASFPYWQNVSQCISILIMHGHYYPTMFSVELAGDHYYFARWMLSRKIFQESDIFNELIRSLPSMVLMATELEELPIRLWLNVLLDTWLDQIVRHQTSSAFDNSLQKMAQTEWFQRYSLQWFYYMNSSGYDYFLVTNKQEQVLELNKLISQIEDWHKDLIGTESHNPIHSLKQFKSNYMLRYIQPLKLHVHLEALDKRNPFTPWSMWNIQLSIEAIQEGSTTFYAAEEVAQNHPSSAQWITDQIERLHDIGGRFFPIDNKHRLRQFSFQAKAEEVLPFYKRIEQKEDLDKVQFHFPEELMWQNWTEEEIDLSLDASPPPSGILNLGSIINFQWHVSVGEISLPIDQLEHMIHNQYSFFQHNGEWLELPMEKLQEAYQELTEVKQNIGEQGRMADLLKLSITEKGRKRKHMRLALPGKVDNYLDKLLKKPFQKADLSSSFQGELRPYQLEGFYWLHALRSKGIGGCLADDMGLGKTIQIIAFLLTYKESRRKKKQVRSTPILIVCPTSIIGNWQMELATFAPSLKVYAHHGAHRKKEFSFADQEEDYDVIITSYRLLILDVPLFTKVDWPIVILDEAQAIKNPLSKQSQITRQLQAEQRIVLTGTPMENRLEELWSIMDFLNPGYLGSLASFRKSFIVPIENHGNQAQTELLKQLIQPFLLRRLKTDTSIIEDLPSKLENKVSCPLSTLQASMYSSIVEELMQKIAQANGIQRKGIILATLTKLKQLCNHPQLLLASDGQKLELSINDSGKLQQCLALLKTVFAKEQSSLVFTQYVKMGSLLYRFLEELYPDIPLFFLHGGLPSVKREELIDRFRSYKNKKAVFILSLKAGGVGLNLTEANHVIHYDRWWNPAVEDQATDRTYRIGQQKDVHVYKLISKGTLEEKIDELIDKKRNLTDQILGQGENWVTELNDEQVYELIRLREQVMK